MEAPQIWPWRAKVSPNGKRAEVYGPDGRYRGAMTARKALALVAELNAHDSRIAIIGPAPESESGEP